MSKPHYEIRFNAMAKAYSLHAVHDDGETLIGQWPRKFQAKNYAGILAGCAYEIRDMTRV